ncbi:MAG: GspH/FimT family pseudopilin [Nitrospirae bacterium]|nr:GspH/FimT family pseudopilin [Nitrospirota bacterium]
MRKSQYRTRKAEENSSSLIFCPSLSLQHSAGFTLIELIIVLMIIGISLGLVGMFVNQGASNLELKRVTKEIATTLRYARNQAVSEKKVYSFVIRESDGTYSLYAADTAEHNEDDAAQSVMNRTLPDKLKVNFDERGEGSLRIDFFPGGNSTGGVIDIRNQADRNLLVTVNRLTGKVEIRKNLNSY